MKLQKFLNDKDRVCDKAECQTLIQIGEYAVKQIRKLGSNKYFHERCRPR